VEYIGRENSVSEFVVSKAWHAFLPADSYRYGYKVYWALRMLRYKVDRSHEAIHG